MNYLIPNYLSPTVLIGSLVTTAAIVFGVHKALQLAGAGGGEENAATGG